MKPARPDPVRAALVFLYLLEGQSDRLAEFFLAEAEHVAAQAQPCPDPDIDRVRYFHLRTAPLPGGLRLCHVQYQQSSFYWAPRLGVGLIVHS